MPLIQRLNLFVRRRRKVMLSTLVGVVLFALLVIGSLPFDYTAQTSLGTNSIKGYDGPVHQLIARVTSRSVLLEVARDSKLAQPIGVGGYLAGAPADAAERLGARVQIQGLPGAVERLAVTTHGSSEEGARAASQNIAERLVAFDRQLRKLSLAQRVSGDEPEPGASGEATRVQLEELRQRFPLLRDSTVTERHQRAASTISSEEIALTAQRVRVRGYEAKARSLEQQVRDEATRAYEADLAMQARSRARQLQEDRREEDRRSRLSKRDDRPRTAGSSRGSSPAVSTLEERLSSLRTRYTDRHPEIRRLMREIESASQGQTEPVRQPDEDQSRPISAPLDPRSLLIADGDEAGPPAPFPAPMPAYWQHKAPSYSLWIEAKNQAAEERIQLEARERAQESRRAELAARSKELEGLEASRLDEQRLLAKLAEEELVQKRSTELPPLHRPLLLGEQARVVDVVSPWRGLPLALLMAFLAALLAGWLAEIQDRSFHLASEITQRAELPVLGVIPHLRGR